MSRTQFQRTSDLDQRYHNFIAAVLDGEPEPRVYREPNRTRRRYEYDSISRLRLIFIRPSQKVSGLTLKEEAALQGTKDLPCRCQKCGEYAVVNYECLKCGRIQR